jgi:hypothetical protein
MIGENIETGDKVIVKVAKENRDWGYNPCPDDTVAEVVGFSEIHYGRVQNFGYPPGVYPNYCWVNIKLPDGEIRHISISFLEPHDKDKYSRMNDERMRRRKEDPYHDRKTMIRELPETKFWEGDFVRCKDDTDRKDCYQIVRTDYSNIGCFCNDGVTPMPIYEISDGFDAGWWRSVRESTLELVERGPIWKLMHDEPVVFESLEEETRLTKLMGHYKEVRNPDTSKSPHAWTKDEILDAIEEGIAHGLSVSGGIFGGPHFSAILFSDEDLGRRVADATLKGFGRTPKPV